MKESKTRTDAQARLRVETIIKVLSKQMTASEAAKRLSVSRKTYHKWEKRFLSGGLSAVEDQKAGRPVKEVDPEKEELKQMLEKIDKEVTVLKQTIRIHDLLKPDQSKKRGRPPKKKRRRRRREQQGELELGSEPKRGIPGHGTEGDRNVQGRTEARGSPEWRENADSAEIPGSATLLSGSSAAAERTAEKK